MLVVETPQARQRRRRSPGAQAARNVQSRIDNSAEAVTNRAIDNWLQREDDDRRVAERIRDEDFVYTIPKLLNSV